MWQDQWLPLCLRTQGCLHNPRSSPVFIGVQHRSSPGRCRGHADSVSLLVSFINIYISITISVSATRTIQMIDKQIHDYAGIFIYCSLGWRDGSMVKGTDCSFEGPEFKSQHPRGGSQPSVTRSDALFWCVS